MTALERLCNTLSRPLLAIGLIAYLAGCTALGPGASTVGPAPPVQAIPYDQAVVKAADTLFSKAKLPASSGGATARQMVVIDPLIDGVSGAQSVATESMEKRIVDLVKTKYPQFDVQPFTAANVARSPLVFIGTFTPVNKQGQSAGNRDIYRICLALLDIKSGKIISKAREFAEPAGVDITPTRFFKDSPAWTQDPAVEGYIKTCQGTKPGDPINELYWNRIMAASLINEAIAAYDSGNYQRSRSLYQDALKVAGGDQLRVYNGLYLTNWQLGQRAEAGQAFGKIVDHGLNNRRLGVKFLFKPGSTEFFGDRKVTQQYDMWLDQIARRASQGQSCLEVVGHTSRTGPEPLNERLSQLRAGHVKQGLEAQVSSLASRTIANGVGSRETLIGTGTDDARDALDRRVEFRVMECSKPG